MDQLAASRLVEQRTQQELQALRAKAEAARIQTDDRLSNMESMLKTLLGSHQAAVVPAPSPVPEPVPLVGSSTGLPMASSGVDAKLLCSTQTRISAILSKRQDLAMTSEQLQAAKLTSRFDEVIGVIDQFATTAFRGGASWINSHLAVVCLPEYFGSATLLHDVQVKRWWDAVGRRLLSGQMKKDYLHEAAVATFMDFCVEFSNFVKTTLPLASVLHGRLSEPFRPSTEYATVALFFQEFRDRQQALSLKIGGNREERGDGDAPSDAVVCQTFTEALMNEPTYADAVRRYAANSTQIVYDPLSKKDLALHVTVESYWRIQQAASAQRRRPPAAAAWANSVVATTEVATTEAQHALDSELYPAAAAAPVLGATPGSKERPLNWSAKRAARASTVTSGPTRPAVPTSAQSSIPSPPSQAVAPATKGVPSAREPRLCFTCKKPGHSARECQAMVTALEQFQQMMAMMAANNAASAVQPKNGN